MPQSPARLGLHAALICLAVLLLAGGGLAVAALVYPRPLAERLASHLLQRDVRLAALDIGWGESIRLHMRGLHIANSPGAEEVAMVAVAGINAEIDRAALFEGRLSYRRLVIEQPVIVLQRDAQGRGNWAFGRDAASGKAGPPPDGLALLPKNRRQFPDLLDFTLIGGEVRYRTSSGRWLVTALDDMQIRSDNASAPVRLNMKSRYQGIAADLTATTASFDTMRDAAKPFDLALGITARDVRLEFRGVLAEPLDLEGAEGRLSLEARRLGALLVFFGASAESALPLQIAGGFSRKGDNWHLQDARGNLAGSAFQAKLHLQEGPRGGSDAFALDIGYGDLDLKPLLAGRDTGGGGLRPDTAVDAPRIDLRLAVGNLRHDATALLQMVALHATAESGEWRLRNGRAHLAGGALSVAGALRAAEGDNASLALQARLGSARVDQLALLGGAVDGEALIAGRLDAEVDFSMTGATLDSALRRSDGRLVFALQEGRIARRLIEAASADLRALLRRPGDAMALRCLLGVATLQQGRGWIGPLRLRTAEGNIDGGGTFDPVQRSLDLVVRADPATTGFLALDIPLRIHGPIAGLTALPARDAVLPIQAMPPNPPDFARSNPCLP